MAVWNSGVGAGAGAPASYADAVEGATLEGVRIGVLRQAFAGSDDPDGAAVDAVIESALESFTAAGAVLIDVEIPDLDHYVAFTSQLHLPAITVPAGFTPNGLPVGIELMALPYGEAGLLRTAAGVEAATAARRAPTFDRG
jgi:Asp-tRNA(Asn)/Glu-tRNA(Gln) amidotransferase A subunit family amidase